MVSIGDLVDTGNMERGVVCSVDPIVIRTIEFTSYVPILDPINLKVVTSGYDPSVTIRKPLLDRIRRYVDHQLSIQNRPLCAGSHSAANSDETKG